VSCFSSADESAHYGFSVCMLLQHYREQLGWAREGVVELGTGDATAIADVVAGLPELRVRSFDISAPSVERARENIAARGVADRYTVEFGDFFDRADSAAGPSASTVIANPPYIPAPDRDIRMPELGAGCTATTWCCSCSRPATATWSPRCRATPTRRRRSGRRRTSGTAS
jgi:Methylase of polypeptide chain release factors